MHTTQICICRVALIKIKKDTKYWCNFITVPENEPTLLEMSDCKYLQLLSINCQVTNDMHTRRQINQHKKQDNSKSVNGIENDLCTNSKTNQEIDYFITMPGMVAIRDANEKQHKNTPRIWQYSLELNALEALPPHRLKGMWGHTKCVEYVLQEPFTMKLEYLVKNKY